MFAQSLFIRQNDEELKQQLLKLGYEFVENTHGDSLVTTAHMGRVRALPHEYFYSSDPHITWRSDRIDCGVNKKMFLALAAINSDTDFMQWFISEKGDWFLCVTQKFDENLANWLNSDTQTKWHKATDKEIFHRFNKR